jgi:vanillate O-demethylase monooxygenase subunit
LSFCTPLFASEAVSAARVACTQEGDTVWCRRFIKNDSPPDFIRKGFGIPPDSLVDRWLDVRWNAPALMSLELGGVVSGEPRERGQKMQQAHLFTPETERTTHYFYATSFPREMGAFAAQLGKDSVEILRGPFENEDRPMIEAIAANMGETEFWDLKPVLLSVDGAAVRARRILRKKIQSELGAASARQEALSE